MHDSKLEAVKSAILLNGLDDWVHIAEVVLAARQATSGHSSVGAEKPTQRRQEQLAENERRALPLGIAAVKELLRHGLIRVGETSSGEFVAWVGSLEQVESRIDHAVHDAQYPLLPGHLFWLENTAAGNEVARSSRRDSALTPQYPTPATIPHRSDTS